MSIRNKVLLVGNVGADVEVIAPENGKEFVKFSLATNESYKNAQGEKVTDTQWHRIVIFGKLAEIAKKYVTKSKEIAIEGKLRYNSYEDKDGVKKYSTDIIANELELLGSKN